MTARALENRVALVVGGGNGLGRSIAQVFAREGAKLAVSDIHRSAVEETMALSESGGLPLSGDVTDHAMPESWVRETVKKFGRLDILVNCAAICLVDPLVDVSAERWSKVFRINVEGVLFCMQAAARVMIPQKSGRIINISSPASRGAFPFFASYAASKAAVDSLSRSAAVDWARHGITVNTLVPGRMTEGMITQLEKDLARVTGRTEADLKAAQTQGLPMGRRVAPAEVAEAAVWLASDAASYVTGERFNFTGGMELA